MTMMMAIVLSDSVECWVMSKMLTIVMSKLLLKFADDNADDDYDTYGDDEDFVGTFNC